MLSSIIWFNLQQFYSTAAPMPFKSFIPGQGIRIKTTDLIKLFNLVTSWRLYPRERITLHSNLSQLSLPSFMKILLKKPR